MDPLRLETLTRRLRERLAALGMSPNLASRRSGLGLSYVNDLLGGKVRDLGRDRLAALAGTLGCDAAWLVGDDLHGDPDGDALAMRVARAIEGECRDLGHALRIARLAVAAAQARPA